MVTATAYFNRTSSGVIALRGYHVEDFLRMEKYFHFEYGTLDGIILQDIFQRMNFDQAERRGRSMSVGDVIKIFDGRADRWYACEGSGWRLLEKVPSRFSI